MCQLLPGHMLNNPDYADVDLKVFEDSISKLIANVILD